MIEEYYKKVEAVLKPFTEQCHKNYYENKKTLEIEKIELFDEEPENLAYKEAHTLFFKIVRERLKI